MQKHFKIFFFFLLLGVVVLWSPIKARIVAAQEPERYPYEHVIRITAVLEYDGERIEVDSHYNCLSRYEGPATRAVTLGFSKYPGLVAYDTPNDGALALMIPSRVCSAFPEIWAGVEYGTPIPDTWTPILVWLNSQDPENVTRNEYYASETALTNPNGRLRIIEGFQVSMPPQETPEQFDALLEVVEQNALTNGLWEGNPPVVRTSLPGPITPMPSYIRITREEWSQPPSYRRAPDRAEDWEGLYKFLHSLPPGEGLMQLDELLNIDRNDAIMYSITDLLWGRRGSAELQLGSGIPQRNEERWGMWISQDFWERAQTSPDLIYFLDEWIPMDIVDGTYVLRTDLPGLLLYDKAYGNWARETDQSQVDFLGLDFVNGPYDFRKSWLLFDLETGDLWVRD